MSRLTICTDNKVDGTNALFIDLPTHFNFQYGVGSYQRHLQEANRLGMDTKIVHGPRLEFDLDTEGDWHKYRQAISDRLYANQPSHIVSDFEKGVVHVQ